ncbi:MAG: NAD(P)-dependent oxidoreductase [Alphaproteobacteria bacterium]
MKKLLVTGAGGFIGRPAAAACAALGFEVHGVGREFDLTDGGARRALINDIRPSHLLHLAWETRHGYFWTAPENELWLDATVDLARCFQEAGGQRAVFAGSCAEYDWTAMDQGVCRENTTPCRPATLYGQAKQAAHDRIAESGLSYAWGRLFLLYGPYEAEARLAPSIIRASLKGEAAELKEPDAIRDFLDARDAGAALAALLADDVAGPVNIASGTGIAIADLAQRLSRLAGGPDPIAPEKAVPDPPRLVADISRLKQEVGFTPARDLDQGLADAVNWWMNQTT